MARARTRGAGAAVVGVAAAVVLLGLGGCSAGGQPVENPTPTPTIAQRWIDKIDSFLASDKPSELERAALADHWVTDAEQAENVEVFGACMRRYGLEPVASADGTTGVISYGATRESQEAFTAKAKDADKALDQISAVIERCGMDEYVTLASYYADMRSNPENKNILEIRREQYLACGIEEVRTTSDQQMKALVEDDTWKARADVAACDAVAEAAAEAAQQ